MNPVVVRNIEIGKGIPKICVPITGETEEKIIEAAKCLLNYPSDLVEWRADWYQDVFEFEKTKEVLKILRQVLGEKPILFTFRTLTEGGEKDITPEMYLELGKRVVDTGDVDLIDIEIFGQAGVAKELIDYAHMNNVKVIASNHDFDKTPDEEVIISRLTKMQELGADILKMAVMPKTNRDVIRLLAATEKMVREYATQPVVTMSMSKKGVVSRIAGEMFGSAITFGTVGKASAPGQISASELKNILELIHG